MSQTQSTRSTILQLPIMQSLRQWASLLIDNGQKGKLVDLLAVFPTIKELKRLQIDINSIDEDQLEELHRIASMESDSRKNGMQSTLKSDLNLLNQEFKETIWRNHNDQSEMLQNIVKAIKAYSNNSSLRFLDYLKKSGATYQQSDAFERYKHLQSQAIQEYIYRQDLICRIKQQIKGKKLQEKTDAFLNDFYNLADTFNKDLWHNEGNSLEILQKKGQKLIFYSNDSGDIFLNYLRDTNATNQQLSAFETYKYLQSQAINNFINYQGNSHFEKGLQQLYSIFKEEIAQDTEDFKRDLWCEDDDEFVMLQKIDKSLQLYSMSSSIKFLNYLINSHATTQQKRAFDNYKYLQSVAIKEYIYCKGKNHRLIEKGLQQLNYTIERDLHKLTEQFKRSLWQNNTDEFEMLQNIPKLLQAYFKDSEIKFLNHLTNSRITTQSLSAYKHYKYFENQAIKKYFYCQQEAIRQIKRNGAENKGIFKSSIPYEEERSQKLRREFEEMKRELEEMRRNEREAEEEEKKKTEPEKKKFGLMVTVSKKVGSE